MMINYDQMKPEPNLAIGIVGGMGPLAGNMLFNRIICNTPAKTDQEHLPVILISFPSEIMDRSVFLDGIIEENPAYAIIGVIKRLEAAGASIVGMACNTSYSAAIYNIIKQELKKLGSRVELLHMPMETCLHLKDNFPESSRIGLMTSNGTYKTGLYKKILQDMNYEVIVPDADFQDGIIHRIVYDPDWGIKACQNKISEKALTMFQQAIEFFKDNQTDAIILGCTEFSLITNAELIKGISIIDATDCLAKAMVKRALAQRFVAQGL